MRGPPRSHSSWNPGHSRPGGCQQIRNSPAASPKRLDRMLLELATLALGQPTPDAEPLVVRERVLQALAAHIATHADLLGLAGGAALLGEERLGIGLRAQGALLPGQLTLVLVGLDQLHVRDQL